MRILSEGIETRVASSQLGECTGMAGRKVLPDLKFDQVRIEEYDSIVIIGGSGSFELRKSESLLNLISQVNKVSKLIGAICLAPTVLSKAGVLEGKEATVWKGTVEGRNTIDIIQEEGAKFVDLPIVTYENVITAQGPEYSVDFARKLVEEMCR
jgi:protease I